MIDQLINLVTNVHLNSTLGICLYWIPVVVCLIGYCIDFRNFYKSDLENYQKSYYDPKLTIGAILGRLVLSFVPVCNLFIAVTRHIWRIIYRILDHFDFVLNIPIIKHNPKPEEKK